MAEGTDTWAALAVLTLKQQLPALELHCVPLCQGQADRWTSAARKIYFSILKQADSIVYVSQTYTQDCMLKRSRYLVDHAACLLAVYNGERRGGTPAGWARRSSSRPRPQTRIPDRFSPECQKIRLKPKIQNSSVLCLQFIYIHPLTLQGGGGKLLLALKEMEC